MSRHADVFRLPHLQSMLSILFLENLFRDKINETVVLLKGVRAGGGIGDEIESPDGDEYEVYRIMFDITFFFFIIVILLAIIQGKHLLFETCT
jgi:hypothetical protein